VCGFPHRGVVHVEVTADRADHDLPGIQPDADVDGHPFAALDLARILLHRRLHSERGIAGPHRMIFMGNGGAEECHDPIAHDLVDRALIAVYRVHHALKDRVEELAGFFGITIGQQFHRSLQVGKEDRNLLAFAFEGGLGGEDFLDQMAGGIAEWSLRLRFGGPFGERRGALPTKGKAGRVGKATGRTEAGEWRSTLPAKLHPRRILKLTARAAHGPPPQRCASAASGRPYRSWVIRAAGIGNLACQYSRPSPKSRKIPEAAVRMRLITGWIGTLVAGRPSR
jgi:hypothetical protein